MLSITIVILVRLGRNEVGKIPVWLHRGNIEKPAGIGTSALQLVTDMNSAQMIQLFNNVSGRVFSPTCTNSSASCLSTLAMYWVWKLLMLSSMTEKRPKCNRLLQMKFWRSMQKVLNIPEIAGKKKQRFHFMPIHNWLF